MGGSVKPYQDVRRKIRDGDVLIFRHSRRPWSWLISVFSRSEYAHAAMAVWWGDSLMCIEMDTSGGRAVMLSKRVKQRPGQIDWYRYAGDRSKSDMAARCMVQFTNCEYGWWALAKVALVHLPVIRWFTQPSRDDWMRDEVPFCSDAISAAYCIAGDDLVPGLADGYTEPKHLAASEKLAYQVTLI